MHRATNWAAVKNRKESGKKVQTRCSTWQKVYVNATCVNRGMPNRRRSALAERQALPMEPQHCSGTRACGTRAFVAQRRARLDGPASSLASGGPRGRCAVYAISHRAAATSSSSRHFTARARWPTLPCAVGGAAAALLGPASPLAVLAAGWVESPMKVPLGVRVRVRGPPPAPGMHKGG